MASRKLVGQDVMDEKEIVSQVEPKRDGVPITLYGGQKKRNLVIKTEVDDSEKTTRSTSIRRTRGKTPKYLEEFIKEEEEYNSDGILPKIMKAKKAELPLNKEKHVYERLKKVKTAVQPVMEKIVRSATETKSREENENSDQVQGTSVRIISVQQKVKILKDFEKGGTTNEIARKYNISYITASRIRRNKNEILEWAKNGKKRAKRRPELPLYKKVEILKELEKGKTVSGIAKEYDLCETTVYRIGQESGRILNSANELLESGKIKNLKHTRIERKVPLPLHEKVLLLKDLEEGKSIKDILKDYDISYSALLRIRNEKDGILHYVNESVKKGEDYNLERTRLPRCSNLNLTLRQKIKFLKECEEGKSIKELAEKYDISSQTAYYIKTKKNQILNIAEATESSKVKGKSTRNKRRSYAKSTTVKKGNSPGTALCLDAETVNTDDNITTQSWTQSTFAKYSKLNHEEGHKDNNVVKEEYIDFLGDDYKKVLLSAVVKEEFTEDMSGLGAEVKEELIEALPGKSDYDDLEFSYI